jgi:hypothetical protein
MEVSSNSGPLGTSTDWLPLVKHEDSPRVTGFGTSTEINIALLMASVSLSFDIQRSSAKGSEHNWSLNQRVCENKVVLMIVIS